MILLIQEFSMYLADTSVAMQFFSTCSQVPFLLLSLHQSLLKTPSMEELDHTIEFMGDGALGSCKRGRWVHW